jgi:hypothetical protein
MTLNCKGEQKRAKHRKIKGDKVTQQTDDLFRAGRLIQWALQPGATPNQNDEYNNLIELYLDRLDFREKVDKIADGLGLLILPEVRSGYSIVLAPKSDSVFLMRMHDYRSSSNYTTDNRLLDGLIHIAIAATVYPRDRDLLEDPTTRRNPMTVDEVEAALRQIVDQLEENSHNLDPINSAEGLYEAWRVYKNRPSTKETKDNRAASGTTRRMIEEAFEYLCQQRCFKKIGNTYQPLRRYQILVQEYAASHLYQMIQRATNFTEGKV